MATTDTSFEVSRTWRLRLELIALYVAGPVLLLIYFRQLGVIAPMLVIVAASLALLAMTPGFRWRELIDPSALWRHLPLILGFALAVAAVATALVFRLSPSRFLSLPRYATDLWLTIMALYPFLSVLGQELFFRPLFFRRYADVLPPGNWAVLANGLAFGLGHLFYANPVAISLTFAGGLVFGWVYQRTRSFLLVFVLHSLAGQIIFTSGLGTYFYHGAIG